MAAVDEMFTFLKGIARQTMNPQARKQCEAIIDRLRVGEHAIHACCRAADCLDGWLAECIEVKAQAGRIGE